MAERLVSQALRPLPEAGYAAPARVGEPGLPRAFAWSGRTIELAEVLDRWKDTGPCSHGSAERYVRRHWFRARTASGLVTLYFERQARTGTKRRWWLYTIDEEDLRCDEG